MVPLWRAQRYVHLASKDVEDATHLTFGLKPKKSTPEAENLLDYIQVPRTEYEEMRQRIEQLDGKPYEEELKQKDKQIEKLAARLEALEDKSAKMFNTYMKTARKIALRPHRRLTHTSEGSFIKEKEFTPEEIEVLEKRLAELEEKEEVV